VGAKENDNMSNRVLRRIRLSLYERGLGYILRYNITAPDIRGNSVPYDILSLFRSRNISNI
jgi:hypothetical protein